MSSLLQDLQEKIAQVLEKINTELEEVKNSADLEEIKNKYLSKKGVFTSFMQNLANASSEEKPALGKIVNEAKNKVVEKVNAQREKFAASALNAKLAAEKIDITLPSRHSFSGSLHPITLTSRRIENWFSKLGFVVRQGPEIEDDFHNFTALNIPPKHPARAMQDTFYFDADTVLRTQTSGTQIHVLEEEPLPLRMIAPGRVYRSDSDQTHSPMFHQCEGLVVDERTTFADLKGILTAFLRDFFERDDLRVRLRPSFFPFTEPSAEVDIGFADKNAADHEIKWLEVLGCGMVHPNVLRNVGIDADKYQGYAFGMGIERLAMLRYGISDLRMFFENDLRFLSRFSAQY
ncbi:MAG: phenylalanine--tRNA ligase subunit alpha [Cardiobacteriaceae bacterium]|nr:phenylalanine--tRNA ligase subunit alpha [Cardiobacteriaceae bacterium]